MPSDTQIMRRRIVSSMVLITGNRRVMRSDSIRNSPIATSVRMITSAAMSEVATGPT